MTGRHACTSLPPAGGGAVIDVHKAFDEAVRHHKAGREAKAEAMYRGILKARPGHPDALHLLGMIALGNGQAAQAAGLIGQAIEIRDGVAAYHFNLASAQAQLGDMGAAIASFEQALALQPGHAGALHGLGVALVGVGRVAEAVDRLREVVQIDPRSFEAQIHLGNALTEQRNLDAALQCYERAVELAPDSVEARENIGMHLVEIGRAGEAADHYRKILAIDPGNGQARWQLRNALSTFVPRWHFGMINDAPRNEAYRRAIERAVTGDSVVLDIGTGSGLLAMIAARAGARSVTTCEFVEPIAEQARAIIEKNGLGDRIEVINKKSTVLEIGADMPEKADVVIFEIFDTMLLGEEVLPVIERARATLASADARIVPRGARIFCMPVQSEDLWRANRVDQACGFDVSPFNLLSSPAIIEDRLDNFDYAPLSDPVEIFAFRFDGDPIVPESRRVKLKATRAGTCHALVCWYRLELDDREILDTGPSAKRTHWAQGLQILDRPMSVRKGQELAIDADHNRTIIRFALDDGAGR